MLSKLSSACKIRVAVSAGTPLRHQQGLRVVVHGGATVGPFGDTHVLCWIDLLRRTDVLRMFLSLTKRNKPTASSAAPCWVPLQPPVLLSCNLIAKCSYFHSPPLLQSVSSPCPSREILPVNVTVGSRGQFSLPTGEGISLFGHVASLSFWATDLSNSGCSVSYPAWVFLLPWGSGILLLPCSPPSGSCSPCGFR